MPHPPWPNFYVVGSPRCGTTAIYEYLRTHPNIFMSEPKELFFWCDDFPWAQRLSPVRLDTVEEYRALFAKVKPQHRVIGEASPPYLLSQRAVPRIHATVPEAKYLVMLRHPVELAISHHAWLLFHQFEDEPSFVTSWKLQTERAQGRSLPRYNSTPDYLQYEKASRLGEQVQRMLSAVPASQVKFVFLDDLVTNPRDAYLSVLEFLGVPDDGRQEFPRINENLRLRFQLIGKLMFSPPASIEPFIRRFRRGFRRSDSRTKALARFLVAPPQRPAPITPEFRAELTELFRTDIELLASLTGRDLSKWLA